MSYGMTGIRQSQTVRCEICVRALHTKMLPLIVDGALKEVPACSRCFGSRISDAALFWQRQGRPMTGNEMEEYEAGYQLPGLGSDPRPAPAHTPGPWGFNVGKNGQVDGLPAVRIYGSEDMVLDFAHASPGRDEANAARIVACVNACEGIADPSLVSKMLAALDLIAHAEDVGIISVKAFGEMESSLRQRVLDAIALARSLVKGSR